MKITNILSHPCIYAVACAMLFADSSLATAITAGQANFDGSVTVSLSTVSFFGNNGVIPNVFNVDTGFGSFTGLTTPDSIKDLIDGPVTGNISVIDFASFSTASGLITFDVTHIDPGIGTLAGCANDNVGNQCTTAGSPFTLTQVTATTVAFTVSMEGFAYTGSSDTGESPAQGLFSGQQVPGSITEVLDTLATSGQFSTSYAASFSTMATPEPGTLAMLLIAAGLMGTSVLRGRRRRS